MRFTRKLPARNLIDAVIDPEVNRSPGELGLASMEVLEAACRSASASGLCVNVEESTYEPGQR